MMTFSDQSRTIIFARTKHPSVYRYSLGELSQLISMMTL